MAQNFFPKKTRKFAIHELCIDYHNHLNAIREDTLFIFVDWNCEYTKKILMESIARRSKYCILIEDILNDPNLLKYREMFNKHPKILQFAEFEKMQWEYVLSERTLGSSYLVRKGLSRKAQLAVQINRYLKKHPNSILHQAVPESHVIETWDIFQDEDDNAEGNNMKIQLGNGFSTNFSNVYDLQRVSVQKKIEWYLAGTIEELFRENDNSPWILKPSVTNKGLDISIISSYSELVNLLEEKSQVREWVMQRYISNPLLILRRQHKFHLRVYVLCIGALQVLMFNNILVLIAAYPYNPDDLDDIYSHLTNTARAAETENFDETKFVKTMRDLPGILAREYPHLTGKEISAIIQSIYQQLHETIHDLFQAYENEYSIFTPMANCFEFYGLDFLITDDFRVVFLEVNPGPDFKQTGDKLSLLIEEFFDSLFRLIVDSKHLIEGIAVAPASHDDGNNLFLSNLPNSQEFFSRWIPGMDLVYSKEWSVNQIKNNLSFI